MFYICLAFVSCRFLLTWTGTGHEAMTALRMRNSPGLCYWVSLVLFLIFIQMLTSLVVFGGEFISSSEMVIGPFRFCLIDNGEKICDVLQRRGYCNWGGAAVTTVCLCLPLVLVAFASLASLFAAYGRDDALLRFSVALQVASIVLVSTGLISFVAFHHFSWKHATVWFYVCAGVPFELAVVTLLTYPKLGSLNRKPPAAEML